MSDSAVDQTAARPMCRWVQEDEGSDLWETACKHYFALNEGTPSDNAMEYCCYCGKHLEEAPWEEEPDVDPTAPPCHQCGAMTDGEAATTATVTTCGHTDDAQR